MPINQETFQVFASEMRKIAAEKDGDFGKLLRKIAYEPLSAEGLQAYLGFLGNPKVDEDLARLKQEHTIFAKAKGVPHDAYQAAMRNIGGYKARPGDVLTMLQDPDFQRQYRRMGQPVLDVNTTFAREAGPHLNKLRESLHSNPSFTHAYKLDPAPKNLLPKDLPMGIAGKQIPMNLVSENIPRGRGLITPVTNLVEGMSFNANSGTLENLVNKLRKLRAGK